MPTNVLDHSQLMRPRRHRLNLRPRRPHAADDAILAQHKCRMLLRHPDHMPRHRIPSILQRVRLAKPRDSHPWALPVRKPRQNMKVHRPNAQLHHPRIQRYQLLRQRRTRRLALRLRQHHRRPLEQRTRQPPLRSKRLNRRRPPVIPIHMFPMMPRPPAAFISAQPRPVRMPHAVLPTVPRLHIAPYALGICQATGDAKKSPRHSHAWVLPPQRPKTPKPVAQPCPGGSCSSDLVPAPLSCPPKPVA